MFLLGEWSVLQDDRNSGGARLRHLWAASADRYALWYRAGLNRVGRFWRKGEFIQK